MLMQKSRKRIQNKIKKLLIEQIFSTVKWRESIILDVKSWC